MPTLEPSNIKQIKTEFFFWLAVVVFMSLIGFLLMGNQGIFNDSRKLLFYILYLLYNFIFLGFVGFILFNKEAGSKLFIYFHNFDYSLIQNSGLGSLDKNNVLYKIFSSFFLSLIFWFIILSPLLLLQFALPRETALQILPVTPQVVFPIVGVITSLLFIIFPAATGESGLLAIGDSFIMTPIFKRVKNKTTAVYISLIVVIIASGLGWLFVHGFVSQGSELDQRSHLSFGIEQGFLLVLTGSVAPIFALHGINLLYWGIQELVGQYEFLRVAFPVTIVLVWIAMILLINYLNRKKR